MIHTKYRYTLNDSDIKKVSDAPGEGGLMPFFMGVPGVFFEKNRIFTATATVSMRICYEKRTGTMSDGKETEKRTNKIGGSRI